MALCEIGVEVAVVVVVEQADTGREYLRIEIAAGRTVAVNKVDAGRGRLVDKPVGGGRVARCAIVPGSRIGSGAAVRPGPFGAAANAEDYQQEPSQSRHGRGSMPHASWGAQRAPSIMRKSL